MEGFTFKICQTIAGISMMHRFHRFSDLILGLFLHLAQPHGGSQNQAKPTSYFIPVPGNKDVKVD